MGKGKDRGAEDRSNPSPLPLSFPVKGKELAGQMAFLNKSPIRPAPTPIFKGGREEHEGKSIFSSIQCLYYPVFVTLVIFVVTKSMRQAIRVCERCVSCISCEAIDNDAEDMTVGNQRQTRQNRYVLPISGLEAE